MPTTLTAGDIAFTGLQSDNAGGGANGDFFEFVLLKAVTTGTTIYFTDGGYRTDTSKFRTNETMLRWVAQANLPAGTLVSFTAPGGTAPASTAEWTGINPSTGATLATGSLVLAAGGDNITALVSPAFAGTDGITGTAIAAITLGGATFAASYDGSGVTSTTGLPAGLTDGVNAVSIASIDNAHYTGATTSGTSAALRSAINNDANWSGSNSPLSPPGSAALAVNEVPVIANLDGDLSSWTEDVFGPAILDGNALLSVTDVDSADFSGGTLTVSVSQNAVTAEDVLSLNNLPGSIELSGGNVLHNGIIIGTWTGGTGGTPLVFSFNAASTPLGVTALLRNITYDNSNHGNPNTAQREIAYTLTDGDGGTTTVHSLVNLNGTDDNPVIGNLNGDSVSWELGDGAVFADVGGDATLTDVDTTLFEGYYLEVGSDYGAEEAIGIAEVGGVTIVGADVLVDGTDIGDILSDGAAGFLQILLDEDATADGIQRLMRAITVENVSATPTFGAHNIGFLLYELSNGAGADAHMTFNVAAGHLSVGNRVFFDTDNSGGYSAGDSGIDNVSIDLVDSSSGLIIATTITSGGGFYSFTGLAAGNYHLGLDATDLPAGLVSIPGAGDPDDDIDNDNNGVFGPTIVGTFVFTLTEGGEPTGDGDGADSNLTVDFGFTTANPIIDLDGLTASFDYGAGFTEGGSGIPIVGVNPDITTYTGTVQSITITITDPRAGDSLNLSPGGFGEDVSFNGVGTNQIVISGNITIAEFEQNLSLLRYQSTSTDPGFDLSDLQRTITFVVNDGVHNSAPATTTVTIDSLESLTLGNLVFRDLNANGVYDSGIDSGMNGVTVQLLDATGTNVLGSTTTAGGGLYSFAGLSAGDYVVRVLGSSLPSGYTSVPGATDPDDNVNNDDNGAPSGADYVSQAVTLTEGDEPTNDGDANADTNLSVDFGFVAPVIVPPTVDLNGPGGGIDYAGAYTEGGANAPIGSSIAVTAPVTPITSATITITDALSGQELVVSGMLPATITILSNNGTQLVLTGTGTPADWEAALGLIRFISSSDNPDNYGADTVRQITVTVSDGANSSPAATASIAITAINDAPLAIDFPGAPLTFTEGDGYVLLDALGDAVVFDADSANFAGGNLSFGMFGFQLPEDAVTIQPNGTVTLTGSDVYVGGILIGTIAAPTLAEMLRIDFNGDATPARLTALIRAIAYTNTGGDNPTAGERTFAYVLNDGDGGGTGFGFTVDVVAVNDAPVVAHAIPDQHSNEDSAVLYQFAADTFSDPEGEPLTYTATLANDSPLPAWLLFDSNTRTFSGTPPLDFNGTLSIKVTASDGSLPVSDTFDPRSATGTSLTGSMTRSNVSETGSEPSPGDDRAAPVERQGSVVGELETEIVAASYRQLALEIG